jgi:small subunit ribosomal protein S16
MSVTIRLSRHGMKKKPFFRIVVSDSRYPRDGRFIEQVGTYDPRTNPAAILLDHEKLEVWIKQGAQPSQTVKDIIKRAAKTRTDPDKTGERLQPEA